MTASPAKVGLRLFAPATDLPRLAHWVRQPHVLRWWGDPAVALEAARHRPPENHAVITADGVPVGYLCWETPDLGDLAAAGLSGLPENLVDADILLGEPQYLGHGIGPQAGLLLLEHLRQTGTAAAVGVGLSVDNRRSIRAAEKLGFRLFRRFEDPLHGPCLYLVLDVSTS